MKSLMIIIPDFMSVIVEKGEYSPRYYNPGDLFDDVHIIMTNNDKVDPEHVRFVVGHAHLTIHNLPIPDDKLIENSRIFKKGLLRKRSKIFLWFAKKYQLFLLNQWAAEVVELARKISPGLIRCHGVDYNTYAAWRIKRSLGIPYLVSVHINPDVDPCRRKVQEKLNWKDRLFNIFYSEIEKIGITHADLVLPVYKAVIPYLKRFGCKNYEVAYNVISDNIVPKSDYCLHNPIRIVCVGRLFPKKYPDNLLLALTELPGVTLTIIGDGEWRPRLIELADNLHLSERVIFLRSIPNSELCSNLREYDIFAVHTQHWEIGKAVIEALLAGMPIIINKREGDPVPEFRDDFLMLVENTKQGYLEGLKRLIADNHYREQLGRSAYSVAQEDWAPEKCEAKYAEIYRRYLKA